MRLRRVRVEQFRQFRTPLELRDLAPGVNLIVGPNESGKSTLVAAIRAAFFERHKSGSVDDLLPWGDSAASPSVSLEFDWQGEHWTLSKRFLRQKRCDLDIDGRHFGGDEAEAKLAELMGYELPGRGASKAEHWGVPGLLWIEQGAGQDIQPSVQYAGNYLQSVLGQSLGEVASTAGDALIAWVESERSKLLTARKHAPTGEYAEVLAGCEDHRQQLEALDADIAAYRQQVDQLAELRAQQRQDAERPWESYRTQAEQAQARLAEVQGWRQAQQRDDEALHQADANRQLCRDQLDAFRRQKDEQGDRDRAVRLAEQAVQDREAAGPALGARLEQAQQAYASAEATFGAARQHERRMALQQSVQRLERDQNELRGRLDKCRALLDQLRQQRHELLALRVDAVALKRLRQRLQACSDLDVVQQSLATRLQFDLQPERRLHLGNEILQGQGERLLLEATDLEIPGLGRLQIQPGGRDLGDLARRRAAAGSAVQECLEALGVADLAQAETVAERRSSLQGDVRHGETLLATLAPDGVDALVDLQARLADELQAAQAGLAALPGVGADEPPLPVAAAEAACDATRESLKDAEAAAGSGRQALDLARQALAGAQAEQQRLAALLDSPEHRAREQTLNLQLVEQNARVVALEAAVAQRRAQIEAARPDILEQDVQRFRATADALEAAAMRRDLELASLQSRLEALGAAGLEEQRAERALRLQALERRRSELQRRAAALDLLLTLLRERRQAVTRQIQAPLQAHLQHYLQLLFAGSHLTVDEDLVPQTLVRGADGVQSHADYAALSFGAREQMGLVSRLAYADLLREAGRPTLIILDDALVHSDAERLAQMKRILFDAGQRHQILLFSCHPDNWRDLGVAAVDMEALKRAGADQTSSGPGETIGLRM